MRAQRCASARSLFTTPTSATRPTPTPWQARRSRQPTAARLCKHALALVHACCHGCADTPARGSRLAGAGHPIRPLLCHGAHVARVPAAPRHQRLSSRVRSPLASRTPAREVRVWTCGCGRAGGLWRVLPGAPHARQPDEPAVGVRVPGGGLAAVVLGDAAVHRGAAPPPPAASAGGWRARRLPWAQAALRVHAGPARLRRVFCGATAARGRAASVRPC